MSIAELPTPNAIPLEWVTPSISNDLLDCSLRVAWMLDSSYKSLRRPNTFSELGIVAHGVAEDAAKGRFVAKSEDTRAAVERRWDELAERAEAELSRAWNPMKVPAREQWPGYHLTRARVVRNAVNKSIRLESSKPSTPPSSSAVESTFEDKTEKLRGRPDRVEGPHEARRIVDIKSGLRQAAPSSTQLRQLMIYGHLVEIATGDFVREIAVEDASGNRWAQEFDRAATELLVSDILSAREKFNSATRSGSIMDVASPSADGCRWCPYRVVCSAYWSALEVSWGHGSVFGVVQSSQPLSTGSILEVAVTHPSESAGEVWMISGAPKEFEDAVEQYLSFVNGEMTGIERHLRWRWSTMTWPSMVTSAGPNA
jgi:RecB family exonuclease